MLPDKPVKPEPPVLNESFIEDGKVTGSGETGLKIEVSFFKKDNTLIEKKETTVDGSKWEISFPTGLEEDDYFTAIQNNQDVLSDEVKRILPPVECTIDPISAGENLHQTGTGIPNYWIHLRYQNPDSGGSGGDLFPVGEDGKWRSLNYIPKLESGATITVRQSKYEFDDETKQSKSVTIIVT